jgi:protein gp37
MNKSKIDWTEYTWNPITGCLRGCRYCYAKKQCMRFSGDVRLNLMDQRCIHGPEEGTYILEKPFETRNNRALSFPFGFAPTLHKYRLDWPAKMIKGGNIFVGSMADMFGPWVPDEWLKIVFKACAASPQHNYMFLTKYPQRYYVLDQKGLLPQGDNYWYGTTTTSPDMPYFFSSTSHTFLSVEPILEPLGNELPLDIDWIIVGAESGRQAGKVIPEKIWIDQIIAVCERNKIPVFLKDSLASIMNTTVLKQEYPEKLQRHQASIVKSKLFESCSFCQKPFKKSDMMAILGRTKRGESAKTLGFACTECQKKLMVEMHVEEEDDG